MHSKKIEKNIKDSFSGRFFLSLHAVCVIVILSICKSSLSHGIAMSFSLFSILLITLIDDFEISYSNTAGERERKKKTIEREKKSIEREPFQPNKIQCIIYLLSCAIVHCS